MRLFRQQKRTTALHRPCIEHAPNRPAIGVLIGGIVIVVVVITATVVLITMGHPLTASLELVVAGGFGAVEILRRLLAVPVPCS